MSWNPVKAKKILLDSSKLEYIREVGKVSGFRFKSGREIALIQENNEKVAVYVTSPPFNMPEVSVDRKYEATGERAGRNADDEAVCRSLGFSEQAYSLHVKSESALYNLIDWYQYA